MWRGRKEAKASYCLVYLCMVIDLPPSAIKAIDRIRRGFLWRGRKEAKGGVIAWIKVCFPCQLGGLGIANLQNLAWALRERWLRLKKHIHWCSKAFCSRLGNPFSPGFSTGSTNPGLKVPFFSPGLTSGTKGGSLVPVGNTNRE